MFANLAKCSSIAPLLSKNTFPGRIIMSLWKIRVIWLFMSAILLGTFLLGAYGITARLDPDHVRQWAAEQFDRQNEKPVDENYVIFQSIGEDIKGNHLADWKAERADYIESAVRDAKRRLPVERAGNFSVAATIALVIAAFFFPTREQPDRYGYS